MKMLIIYYSLQHFDLDTDLIMRDGKGCRNTRPMTKSISRARAPAENSIKRKSKYIIIGNEKLSTEIISARELSFRLAMGVWLRNGSAATTSAVNRWKAKLWKFFFWEKGEKVA